MTRPALSAVDARSAKVPAKAADPVYGTAEHREWRAAVLRRAGGQCQAQGCGRVGVRLFADHIQELRDGGDALDVRNGQALCGACHTRKTALARARRQMGRGG